jgi:uncharacterized protein YkwD
MWQEWFPQLPVDVLQEAVDSFPRATDSQAVAEYVANELVVLYERLGRDLERLRAEHRVSVVSEAIGVIMHAVNNLVNQPMEKRFWKINCENRTFSLKVGQVKEAMQCLETIGFKKTDEKTLECQRYDKFSLKLAQRMLQKELVDVEMQKGQMDLHIEEKDSGLEHLPRENRIIEQVLEDDDVQFVSEDVVANEIQNHEIISLISDEAEFIMDSQLDSDPTKSSSQPSNKSVPKPSLDMQLREIRAKKHQNYRRAKLSKQPIITIADLQKKRHEEEKIRQQFRAQSSAPLKNPNRIASINDFFEPDRIGRDALDFTNDFRKENKLPPLKWHQEIANIGKVHSKDMGEGKVPFGHQGFKERVSKFPLRYQSAAENVAMNNGTVEIARVAVDGWIDSP